MLGLLKEQREENNELKRKNEYLQLCNEEQKEIIEMNEEGFYKLEDRINKAIEYIEYALDEEKETPSKYEDWRLDLLGILKGSDKE